MLSRCVCSYLFNTRGAGCRCWSLLSPPHARGCWGLQISSDAKDAGEGEQAAAKIFRLTDEPLNIDPLSEEGAKPVETEGALGFKNIFFAYPSRPNMQVCVFRSGMALE